MTRTGLKPELHGNPASVTMGDGLRKADPGSSLNVSHSLAVRFGGWGLAALRVGTLLAQMCIFG